MSSSPDWAKIAVVFSKELGINPVDFGKLTPVQVFFLSQVLAEKHHRVPSREMKNKFERFAHGNIQQNDKLPVQV